MNFYDQRTILNEIVDEWHILQKEQEAFKIRIQELVAAEEPKVDKGGSPDGLAVVETLKEEVAAGEWCLSTLEVRIRDLGVHNDKLIMRL